MHILITSERYYPHVGGAEEVCRRLAEALVQRGNRVTVATGQAPERERSEHNGVGIRDFDVSGNWAMGMRGDVQGFQDFLLAGGFDVSFHYAAQTWTTDAMLPLLGKLPSPAVLAPCGYSGLLDPRYGRYFARLKTVLPGFAAMVHHSDIYQDAHYARDAGLRRCFTIPNAIDPAEFAADGPSGAADLREVLGIDARPMVLSVANFTGGKGHSHLITSFQAVASSEWVLALVGNDSPKGCLVQCRAAAANDPRILVLEGLPRDRVVQAFHAADVFVLASNVECSPLVLLEAMACGLPWISTPVGNVNELAGGIVCPVHEQGERLRYLLQDARHRHALGQKGREAAQARISLGEAHDAYERLFERVATGHDLVGAPVVAERFGIDIHQVQGLTSYEHGDMTDATAELVQSVERDPTAAGLRIPLLDALLHSSAQIALDKVHEIILDEVELTPWLTEPNLILFFVKGALGRNLSEAEERTAALGLPTGDLHKLAERGHELAERGEETVLEGLRTLVETVRTSF